MHIAVTGSSGFLGEAIVRALRADGDTVTRLVRRAPGPGELRWDVDTGELDAAGLRGVDAVVHLAGEGIAARRWSPEQKQRILESRTRGTGLVARTLASMDDGPRTLVSASAVGYYGDRGDAVLAEDAGPGDDFLAGVVTAWEAAADPAREAGVRVVHPRIGIVQHPDGGALGRMLPLFRLGVGGRIGSGRQWWPWVSRDDVVGLVRHALRSPDLEGPVNAVAPDPVTNAEYTRTLGRVLGRPTLLPIPLLGPSVLLGPELARSLLATSARVVPARAEAVGYAFRHPDLEGCLRDLLDRPAG